MTTFRVAVVAALLVVALFALLRRPGEAQATVRDVQLAMVVVMLSTTAIVLWGRP